MRSVVRRVRSLWRQGLLFLAYLAFRIRHRALASSQTTDPSKVVLIVNFSETPHRAKTEGLMAKALAFREATPVVVTHRVNVWEQRYFQALGVRRFLFLEDFEDPTMAEQDGTMIRAFLAKRPTQEQLLAYAYGNVNVGNNVLSTVLRQLKRGSIDLENEDMVRLTEQTFLRALSALRAAKTLLERERPVALLFNEAGYTPYGELFGMAVAMGLNTVQYLHAQRLDAFVLKRSISTEKVDAVSVSPESWERLKAMPWTAEDEEVFMQDLCRHYEDGTWFNLIGPERVRHLTPDETRRRLGLDPAKKTAVVFSHVVWDASFFFAHNLFQDYDDWLIETVKAACDNPNVNWVIKLHPYYVWFREQGHSDMRDLIALRTNIGTLPPHITVVPPDTDISAYSIFGITDYCVTVRGTVGTECPVFGSLVFTAGSGRYSGLGFTEDSMTREEYVQKMHRIHETPPLSAERRTLARKHLYALFVARTIPCSSLALVPLYRNGQTMNHRVDVYARSDADLRADAGLSALARWILESRDADYLDLPPNRTMNV